MQLADFEVDTLKDRGEKYYSELQSSWNKIGMLWDNLPTNQQYSVGGEIFKLSWTGEELTMRVIRSDLHDIMRSLHRDTLSVLMEGLTNMYLGSKDNIFIDELENSLELALWIRTPPVEGQEGEDEWATFMLSYGASSMTSSDEIDKILRTFAYSAGIIEYFLLIALHRFREAEQKRI